MLLLESSRRLMSFSESSDRSPIEQYMLDRLENLSHQKNLLEFYIDRFNDSLPEPLDSSKGKQYILEHAVEKLIEYGKSLNKAETELIISKLESELSLVKCNSERTAQLLAERDQELKLVCSDVAEKSKLLAESDNALADLSKQHDLLLQTCASQSEHLQTIESQLLHQANVLNEAESAKLDLEKLSSKLLDENSDLHLTVERLREQLSIIQKERDSLCDSSSTLYQDLLSSKQALDDALSAKESAEQTISTLQRQLELKDKEAWSMQLELDSAFHKIRDLKAAQDEHISNYNDSQTEVQVTLSQLHQVQEELEYYFLHAQSSRQLTDAQSRELLRAETLLGRLLSNSFHINDIYPSYVEVLPPVTPSAQVQTEALLVSYAKTISRAAALLRRATFRQ